MNIKTGLGIWMIMMVTACHSRLPEETPANTGTPVTVASPVTGTVEDTVVLNATATFLLKTFVKAVANGFLQTANVKLGQHVSRGQVLFSLKTKEAVNLGNTINRLDSSFRFTGLIPIRATGNGYITQLAYQAGNYVQDGEQLATISDDRSFVFILNLPYELTPYLQDNRMMQLQLPDGQRLAGRLGEALPSVDSVAQTQHYVVRITSRKLIPENLVAKVILIKSRKTGAVLLPRAALLTNESQTDYWIMKLKDSITAVKVPVQKGLEAGDRVEVLSPILTAQDRVLVSGNYGLPDTARVIIINH
ncbi:efflux RND transporter periplasmic adaptor subunit [Chitinophaga flava]|uniref:RND transporter n=1 Tax=Chitinophaga flava TaxID=2259036 RepID=A0A365XSB3_9BACT|nr:HlyD family efflux transporter periplasmic adaptor subunit [Chitinophaga flava]RBL88911.1 RND transporter [Chitinophaga flava]